MAANSKQYLNSEFEESEASKSEIGRGKLKNGKARKCSQAVSITALGEVHTENNLIIGRN